MSISSMIVPDVRRALPAAEAADRAPAARPDAAVTAANAIDQIVTYIPTEIVTAYVALVGAMHKAEASVRARWIAFVVVLILTAVVTWILFAIKVRAAGGPIPTSPSSWPLWKILAAMIAFVAWAVALPQGPFWEATWFDPIYSPIVLLVTTIALGLFGALLEPRN